MNELLDENEDADVIKVMAQLPENYEYQGIEKGITEFRRRLPGWWFTLGVCHVSCDVTIGPDSKWSPFSGYDESIWRELDDGISVDLAQPSRLVDALTQATDEAIALIMRSKSKRGE